MFGFNTFVALLFQTALTMAVADDVFGAALAPREQFVVYGGYWISIGALFLVIFCVSCARDGNYVERCRNEGLWLNNAR